MAPAGLGAQDAGYVIFARAVPSAGAASLGAALALVKRLKEAAFVALGHALMPGPERAPAPPVFVGEREWQTP